MQSIIIHNNLFFFLYLLLFGVRRAKKKSNGYAYDIGYKCGMVLDVQHRIWLILILRKTFFFSHLVVGWCYWCRFILHCIDFIGFFSDVVAVVNFLLLLRWSLLLLFNIHYMIRCISTILYGVLCIGCGIARLDVMLIDDSLHLSVFHSFFALRSLWAEW